MRDRTGPKAFSAESDVDPWDIPVELPGVKRDAHCEAVSHHARHRLSRGQRGYIRTLHTTHSAMNTQDVDGFLSFLQRLPRLAADVPVLVVLREKNEERAHKTSFLGYKRPFPFHPSPLNI